jgi:hypothetical protein
MLTEPPTSNEVFLIADQIRSHKLKKPEEFVKKFDHIEAAVTDIEAVNTEDKNAVVAALTNELRVGVGLC